jgi:integrase
MELAYQTGQRQGDILDLKWADCHTEGLYFAQGKSGGKKKLLIAMDPVIDSILKRCWALSGNYKNVISTTAGNPFSHEGFRALWQRGRRKLIARGILKDDFPHFHDIRAKAVSDSETIEEASARAGHQTTAITKTVYDRSIRKVPGVRKAIT